MSDRVCIKCGGTGILVSGEVCDCGCKATVQLPFCADIPGQYQDVRFNKAFLNPNLPLAYGQFMEKLITDCTEHSSTFNTNLIICAPPNSGKTIFAYTVYGIMFGKGRTIPKLMDIIEARHIMLDYYGDQDQSELLSTSKIAIIKLPMDLPSKFPETISTIIERRVRNNCATIFLYNGTKEDLLAQDRFGKMKQLIGDGSYNSVKIESWSVRV